MDRRQGVTLVETLLGLLLTGIVLMGVASFLRSGITLSQQVAVQTYLEQSAQSAVILLADELRLADPKSLYINSARDWLSFNTADHTVAFGVKDQALFRDLYDGAGRQPITDERTVAVDRLQFTVDPVGPVVEVKLILRHKLLGLTAEKGLTVELTDWGSKP